MNRFSVWASSYSFELYLAHSLVFVAMVFCLKDMVSLYSLIALNLIWAYVASYGYSWLLMKTKLK